MPWFLDTQVEFRVSNSDGADGLTAIESLARRGDSPPYHVHHTEDEVLHLMDGELIVMVDGDLRRVQAGQTCLLPKGVPHTYQRGVGHRSLARGDDARRFRAVRARDVPTRRDTRASSDQWRTHARPATRARRARRTTSHRARRPAAQRGDGRGGLIRRARSPEFASSVAAGSGAP